MNTESLPTGKRIAVELDAQLRELDRSERYRAARKWYEENKEAIDSYNEMIEKYGLFSVVS